jgi:hypothetical protein
MKRTNSEIAKGLAEAFVSTFHDFTTTECSTGCLVFSEECTDKELLAAASLLSQISTTATTMLAFAEGDLWNQLKRRRINCVDFLRNVYGPDKGNQAAKRWSRRGRIAKQIPLSNRCLDLPFQYYVRQVEQILPHIVMNNNYAEADGVEFDLSGDPIRYQEKNSSDRPLKVSRKVANALIKVLLKKSPSGGESCSLLGDNDFDDD